MPAESAGVHCPTAAAARSKAAVSAWGSEACVFGGGGAWGVGDGNGGGK